MNITVLFTGLVSLRDARRRFERRLHALLAQCGYLYGSRVSSFRECVPRRINNPTALHNLLTCRATGCVLGALTRDARQPQ